MDNQLKIGDIVECIDDQGCANIKINELYEITGFKPSPKKIFIYIKFYDDGKKSIYNSHFRNSLVQGTKYSPARFRLSKLQTRENKLKFLLD